MGPLACLGVDFALGAVGPCHLDRDRDVADVLDVQARELAAPRVRWVLDGFPVHPSSVEHMSCISVRVQLRLVPGTGPACGCVDLGRGGRTSLPSMRMLHLGLRVSDLEQSLAFYTALGYAELGRVPETEFGSLTMLQLPDDPTQALTAAPQRSMSAGR